MAFSLKGSITKALYDSHDARSFRVLYEKVEAPAGGEESYKLREDLSGLADVISGMDGVNHKLREEIKDLQKSKIDLSPLAKYGASVPDIVKEVETRFEAAATSNTAELQKKFEKEYSAARDTLQGEYSSQIDTLKQERDQAIRNHEGMMVDMEVRDAISKLNGNARLLVPLVKQHLRADKTEEGGFRVNVIDSETGVPRRNARMELLSVGEYLEELRESEDLSIAFRVPETQGTVPVSPAAATDVISFTPPVPPSATGEDHGIAMGAGKDTVTPLRDALMSLDKQRGRFTG